MFRRNLLLAAVGSVAMLPFTSERAQASNQAQTLGGPASNGPGCACYPISVDYAALAEPNGEMRLERYWPAQIHSSTVARWDFDLSLVDDSGIPRTFHAWQLRRTLSGQVSAGGGLRMRFPPGSSLGALATVHRRDSRGGSRISGWAALLPNATLAVITTARASTGVPPAMELLRFDPVRRELSLSSGDKRDFDALLIQTR